LWISILLALAFGGLVIFGMTQLPARLRGPIVALATFLAGLFYVLYYLWPQPVARQPGDVPLDFVEGVGFWLKDAFPVIGKISNTLSAFMLGLGVFSVVRVHSRRLIKGQKDWGYSVVLLTCVVLMVLVGYWDWFTRQGAGAEKLQDPANWTSVNVVQDFLFDGLLQQMDAAMFSLIAFYILSAAYRAFRIRSIEATMLLATALIVILSLMGIAAYAWDGGVEALAGTDPNSFLLNFRLETIAAYIQDTFQTPSIRAIDWGIGIGALAMGLRLWLSLEKLGGNS
jgi:hypothetical protein